MTHAQCLSAITVIRITWSHLNCIEVLMTWEPFSFRVKFLLVSPLFFIIFHMNHISFLHTHSCWATSSQREHEPPAPRDTFCNHIPSSWPVPSWYHFSKVFLLYLQLHFQIFKLKKCHYDVVFEISGVHFEAIFPMKILAMLTGTQADDLTMDLQVDPGSSESWFNWDTCLPPWSLGVKTN